MASGIYKIVNRNNGSVYVGKSVDIPRRWREHKARAARVSDSCSITRAMAKYGVNSFVFSVVELCDASALNERETHWILTLKRVVKLYNATDGGDGGVGHSAEYMREMVKRRKSDNTGRVWVNNGQTNIFLRKGEKPPDGYSVGRILAESTHTKESNAKRSATLSGKNRTKLHRDNLANSLIGKNKSEQHRKNMARAVLGGKKILCVETGVVYETLAEIEHLLGVHRQSIWSCCNGRAKTAGGFHWKYV